MLYPDVKDLSTLSEEQKQTVSTLATISAGIAGGLAGDSTASAAAGAQGGKNAVENNSLSVGQNQDRIKELSQCQGNSGCETGVTEKYKQQNAEQHKSVVECKGAQACVDKANEVGGLQTAYANRLGELSDKLHSTGNLTTEEKQEWAYLQVVLPQLEADRNAAIHNALMSGDSEEAKQLAVNSLAQVVGTSAAGIAAGINKGGKYQPNQGAVGNMNEFLKQPGFGSDVKNTAQKSSQQYQGQSVYKATGDIGDHIKKGDQFYLDGQHKNHIEVFDKRGNFRAVLNLDGTINESKTKAAEGSLND
nr:VENN motif pre-toxin domain-containing protein [Enterobacter hormaechei]